MGSPIPKDRGLEHGKVVNKKTYHVPLILIPPAILSMVVGMKRPKPQIGLGRAPPFMAAP